MAGKTFWRYFPPRLIRMMFKEFSDRGAFPLRVNFDHQEGLRISHSPIGSSQDFSRASLDVHFKDVRSWSATGNKIVDLDRPHLD